MKILNVWNVIHNPAQKVNFRNSLHFILKDFSMHTDYLAGTGIQRKRQRKDAYN